MKKQLLLLVAMLLPLVASAYDIAVENAEGITIYYSYINNGTELQVTYKSWSAHQSTLGSKYTYTYYGYEGVTDLVIPEEVTYMERTRKVTGIGPHAFKGCSTLKSVTIPNTVTDIYDSFEGCTGLSSVVIGDNVKNIDSSAFKNCTALTSIAIPNSVTSVGKEAFSNCSGLTSVTVGNSVTSIGEQVFSGCSGLTSVTIGNSVTSIDNSAFSGCSSLQKVIVSDIAAWCKIKFDRHYANPLYFAGHLYSDENTEIKNLVIPNNVTSISDYAFDSCSGLTSIIIPNSVTSIGEYAFRSCSGLTSVTIGNSVTSIGDYAFYGCSGLTSVTIPNSVTSIGSFALSGCSSLTSIIIPNSVTNIGRNAFDGCNIAIVTSLIENPFTITGKSSYERTFSLNTFNNATLYVPQGTIDKYKATSGWKDFLFIEEGTGGGGGTTPEKCEKPTIGYSNGKLTFVSSTEGATCHYSITNTDIKAGSGSEVQLGVTYNISVYAAKVGCENSETATATLCWIDVEPKTEGITNSIANVPAKAVLIQTAGGAINVQGCDDGEQVSVYSINGSQVGTAVSQNGAATVNTTLQSGSVAIIKVGKKSIKVMMK